MFGLRSVGVFLEGPVAVRLQYMRGPPHRRRVVTTSSPHSPTNTRGCTGRPSLICCHAASVRPTRLHEGRIDLGLAVSLRKIVAAFLDFLARDIFDARRYEPGVPERVGKRRAAPWIKSGGMAIRSGLWSPKIVSIGLSP